VTAITRTKLLVLDAADFKELIAEEAAIAPDIERITHERTGPDVGAEDSDLTSEEVASGDLIQIKD
jgi:hypothetical protein